MHIVTVLLLFHITLVVLISYHHNSNVVKSLVGLSAIHTVCLVGVVVRLGIAFRLVEATLGCRSVCRSFIAEAKIITVLSISLLLIYCALLNMCCSKV